MISNISSGFRAIPQEEEKKEEELNENDKQLQLMKIQELSINFSKLDNLKDPLIKKIDVLSLNEANDLFNQYKSLKKHLDEQVILLRCSGRDIGDLATRLRFYPNNDYVNLMTLLRKKKYPLEWIEDDYPISVQKIRLSLKQNPAQEVNFFHYFIPSYFAEFFEENEIAKSFILTSRSWAVQLQSSGLITILFEKLCFQAESIAKQNSHLPTFCEISEKGYLSWVEKKKPLPFSLVEISNQRSYFRSNLLKEKFGYRISNIPKEITFPHPNVLDVVKLNHLFKEIKTLQELEKEEDLNFHKKSILIHYKDLVKDLVKKNRLDEACAIVSYSGDQFSQSLYEICVETLLSCRYQNNYIQQALRIVSSMRNMNYLRTRFVGYRTKSVLSIIEHLIINQTQSLMIKENWNQIKEILINYSVSFAYYVYLKPSFIEYVFNHYQEIHKKLFQGIKKNEIDSLFTNIKKEYLEVVKPCAINLTFSHHYTYF